MRQIIKNLESSVATSNDSNGSNVELFADELLDKNLSFGKVLEILSRTPKAIEAGKKEATIKEKERVEKLLKDTFGEDYDLVISNPEATGNENTDSNGHSNIGDNENGNSEIKGVLKKAHIRPKAANLQKNEVCIAAMTHNDLEGNNNVGKFLIKIYDCGYGVYDNGNRTTVIWLPDCRSFIYKFNLAIDGIDKYVISEETLLQMTWPQVLTLFGEEQILRNMTHKKSQGTDTAFEDEEENMNILDCDKKSTEGCIGVVHIDDPETAFIKAETRKELSQIVHQIEAKLTDKQAEVYKMYYEYDFSRKQISEILGISYDTVADRLEGIHKKFRKYAERLGICVTKTACEVVQA